MSIQENGRKLRIGDVCLVKFEGIGSEQQGERPALVFQNNVGNAHSPNIIVLPMTSVRKKVNQPTHVFVPKSEGMKLDSMVLCENPQCVSKDRLGAYITTLSKECMAKVAEASILASSVISFISSPEVLLALWKKAVALNGVRATSV